MKYRIEAKYSDGREETYLTDSILESFYVISRIVDSATLTGKAVSVEVYDMNSISTFPVYTVKDEIMNLYAVSRMLDNILEEEENNHARK